jgi:hypothetical protein
VELYFHFFSTPSWRGAQLKRKKHRTIYEMVNTWRLFKDVDHHHELMKTFSCTLHDVEDRLFADFSVADSLDEVYVISSLPKSGYVP